MNNTIDTASRVSFNSRYLKINNPEKFPQKVYDAIYKSDAIEEFLKEGKPKTLWGKIKDLFTKDDYLKVSFKTQKKSEFLGTNSGETEKESLDPFAIVSQVFFSFKEGGKIRKNGFLTAFQEGVMPPFGVIRKPSEHHIFKEPSETVADKLAKQIEELKNMDTIWNK